MRADKQAEVLTCWKEIASYLGKGVRTVQRWEAQMGLPVRRPEGAANPNKVLAIRSELDQWLAKRWTHRRASSEPVHQSHKHELPSTHQQVEKLKELCQRNHELGYEFLLAQIDLATTFVVIAWKALQPGKRAVNIATAQKAYHNAKRLHTSLRLDVKQRDELSQKLSFLEMALLQLSSQQPDSLRDMMNPEYLMKIEKSPELKQSYSAKLDKYREQLSGPGAMTN